MKNNFNQMTKQEKIIYVIQCVLNVAIVVFIAFFFILRIKTGQYIPLPLAASILIALVGVSRILTTRKRFQGSEESRKQFNKITIRSIILAPIITIIFITIVVLIKIKLG